jgi:hypothetical protein
MPARFPDLRLILPFANANIPNTRIFPISTGCMGYRIEASLLARPAV